MTEEKLESPRAERVNAPAAAEARALAPHRPGDLEGAREWLERAARPRQEVRPC